MSSQTLSFTSSGGYVAISTDTATLEEYVRSSGSPAKPLREARGLAEAAQKVGGMDTGMFNYENQRESYRVLWEAIRKDPDAVLNSLFFQFDSGEEGGLSDWLDFSLLPDFDRVAKYFGIAVMTGATTPDGYVIRAYGPTPAELR